jgi:hypothetical protein
MAAQSLVDRELGRLGSARAVIGQRVRCRRAIATSSAGVALKLAADRRWAAFQPRSDRTHRLTTRASQRDLLPLCKRQTTPFEIPPTPRTDPVLSSQPPSALLPIGTRFRGGGSDELATRHRRPEHLHDLGDHPVRKPRHQRLRSPSQQGNLAGPGLQTGQRADRRSRLALRAQLRDDRRATQPGSSDDPENPSNWAGVAITARTQGSPSKTLAAPARDASGAGPRCARWWMMVGACP